MCDVTKAFKFPKGLFIKYVTQSGGEGVTPCVTYGQMVG